MKRALRRAAKRIVGALGVPVLAPFRSERSKQGFAPSAPARALKSLTAGTLPAHAVTTLLQYGEHVKADLLVRRLLESQRFDGSWADVPAGTSPLLDTADALRGLLASRGRVPDAAWAATRAAEYLRSRLTGADFGADHHLCVVTPFREAATILDKREWQVLAEERVRSRTAGGQGTAPVGLTSEVACELHALIEVGRADCAAGALEAFRARQEDTGAVPAAPGKDLVHAAALAELAICWYKKGLDEAADRAVDWLEAHQTGAGGFPRSVGAAAEPGSGSDDPRAAKFYLDACRLRVIAWMERHAGEMRPAVPIDDGRTRALLEIVGLGDRIVEVGCGKGRFLKAIREAHPNTECTGVDISPKLLAEVPREIRTLEGPLECVPLDDDSFDLAFSVEAIEHSANPEAAVAELIRIVKPGGWVAIIDKQQSHWGELECPPWERWPKAGYLRSLLARGCDDVSVRPTAYDDQPASGLMVVWRGRKRLGPRRPAAAPWGVTSPVSPRADN